MARKTFLLILGILASIIMQAQSADDFLKKAIEKNKSYNDISVIFNYQMINNSAGVYENINGYASMKGGSYIMNIDGQEMVCDGTTLWTHLVDDEEVMISEVTDENNTSPIAIIDSFSQNITASFVESDNPDIKIIEVKENEGDTFETVRLYFDIKDLNIKKVHIIVGDGNEFIYEITDFKTNQNLPDNMFIFDENLYPNVEVIDMR
ncbi:MAG: outer membrane lipoprotein carrier protein LolA [Lentimicrobiaceae bacterium]|nr:outer membrane lipoprotein carrier protein LolA [Lentimicrobiaceae bacterium]